MPSLSRKRNPHVSSHKLEHLKAVSGGLSLQCRGDLIVTILINPYSPPLQIFNTRIIFGFNVKHFLSKTMAAPPLTTKKGQLSMFPEDGIDHFGTFVNKNVQKCHAKS